MVINCMSIEYEVFIANSKLYFICCSVVVADEKKLEAVMDVVLVVCSGCTAHGTCVYTTVSTVAEIEENYRYASCDCEPYWEGNVT